MQVWLMVVDLAILTLSIITFILIISIVRKLDNLNSTLIKVIQSCAPQENEKEKKETNDLLRL